MRTAVRLAVYLVIGAAGAAMLPSLPAEDKVPEKKAEPRPKGKSAEVEARVAEEERKAEEALRNEVASFGAQVEFGKRYKVAEALVDAGGTLLKLANTDLDELDVEPRVEPAGDASRKEPKLVSLQAQAEDLFDEARGLGKDMKALEGYIRTVKAKADDGFGTRGAKGGKHPNQVQQDRNRVQRDRIQLDKDRVRLDRDVLNRDKGRLRRDEHRGKHRDVALNGTALKQFQAALQPDEKHTVAFAPEGKAGAVCFQGSTPVRVEVLAGEKNAVVWSSTGLSGQYQYPAGQNFSLRISPLSGSATYTLLAN